MGSLEMAKEKLYTWDYGLSHIAGEGDVDIKMPLNDYITRYTRELEPVIDNMVQCCGDISVSDMSTMFSLFYKMKRLMHEINENAAQVEKRKRI